MIVFVEPAAQPRDMFTGSTDLLLGACTANPVGDDRFAHNGPVGLLLRGLSRHHPERVAEFVRQPPACRRRPGARPPPA